jgi:hypothetical protein
LANNSFYGQPGQQGFQNSFAGARPRPPIHPPTANESSLVGVNLKAMPASSLGPKDTFVFRNNSAGLGVPRGSLGKLNSFSGQTAQHGVATTNVYYGGAQRGGAESSAKAGSVGQSMSASQSTSAASQSSRGYSGSMQSASSGAGASHSSMQSGAGGGGGGGGRR